MPTIILAVAAMLLTTTAQAATVHDCGSESEHRDLDSIENLIGNVRDFAKGAIRVAYVLKERSEASSSAHLLIFVLGERAQGGTECYAVSAEYKGPTPDFVSIDMSGLKATYDSNKGLLISVPVRSFDSDKQRSVPGRVKVRISRKDNNNSVTIEK